MLDNGDSGIVAGISQFLCAKCFICMMSFNFHTPIFTNENIQVQSFKFTTTRNDVRTGSPAQVCLTTEPLFLTTKIFDPQKYQIT